MGFVSELNDANLFMITVGMTFSPPVSATHNCVSRAIAAELRGEVSFKVMDGSPSLRKLRRAGEVFATGTMGEAAPVKEINDRKQVTGLHLTGRQEYSLTFTN